ncbi:MAG: signal peptidase II [Acidobacteria bacterium]|nr:signal peptidase II [Acidobacteriota bacterium]
MKSLRTLTALIAVAIVVADQATKHWALNALGDGHTIDIVGSLRFNLAFNTGMAFAKGQGIGPIIAVVGVIVVAYLLVGLRRDTKPGAVLVGMVAGGAAGNIVDRLFRGDAWLRGAVVDFIDLQWWPIFNIADVAIVLGAGALVVSSLLPEKPAADLESRVD